MSSAAQLITTAKRSDFIDVITASAFEKGRGGAALVAERAHH